jgi:hypothetical protein
MRQKRWFVAVTTCIMGGAALASGQAAGQPAATGGVVPPVLTSHVAGESVELEYDVQVKLTHPHKSDGTATFDCSLTQGAHAIRVKGDNTCVFTGGSMKKAGFAPGSATLQAAAVMNGVSSSPVSVELKLEHAGTWWGTGGGEGMLLAEGCDRLRSVTFSGSRLSFLFVVTDPTQGPTGSQIVDLGRISVAVKPNGTFAETVQVPAAAFRSSNLAISGDALAYANQHFRGTENNHTWVEVFKAFAAARTLNVHGTINPDLKNGVLNFAIEVPGDPDAKCEPTLYAPGFVKATPTRHPGEWGDSCATDRDCDGFCKSGRCS